MKYAVIDIGSNSIKLRVYKIKNDKINILFSNRITAGLAYYIEYNIMTYEGIIKAVEVLNEYISLIKNFSVDKYYIYATASIRNIENTTEVTDEIFKLTECRIDVLSSEDEASLGFNGIMEDINIRDGLMIDIGGGSSEAVSFMNGEKKEDISFPIGSLNLYKKFVHDFLPAKEEIEIITKNISKEINDTDSFSFDKYKNIKSIYMIGGTAYSLLKLINNHFDLNKDNKVIQLSIFKKLKELLLNDYSKAKELIIKSCPDRVHTIIPGILILDCIIDKTHIENMIVSDYGLSEGYLIRKIKEEN
ncbi:Ppx/GppA phosphatase family protein [Anaerofustis stercorihominis]|uniref:Ppx/GppA phosphatase family protein n=1 Tax=Anaerofustis stercorihominis TaxID=214853 RepID=UPI00214BD248|nr:hypothetical protein [Anaerofustis stercorihominis]MCR2033752.1 hypothetical protein [Anaerofustis stercorihominis]